MKRPSKYTMPQGHSLIRLRHILRYIGKHDESKEITDALLVFEKLGYTTNLRSDRKTGVYPPHQQQEEICVLLNKLFEKHSGWETISPKSCGGRDECNYLYDLIFDTYKPFKNINGNPVGFGRS